MGLTGSLEGHTGQTGQVDDTTGAAEAHCKVSVPFEEDVCVTGSIAQPVMKTASSQTQREGTKKDCRNERGLCMILLE